MKWDEDDLITDGLPSVGATGAMFACDLHAKQQDFLRLPNLNVLYGGAAGGGKTEALLADCLQYIDRPKYSALVLRRTFKALRLRHSIMDRALEWCGREYWHEDDKKFVFPSGAVVQFGYCDSEGDLDRYQSAQFHRIYIDELTEWPEGWVRFLFSRLRRTVGDSIPIAFRAGTNPGGLGGEWVREMYDIPEGEIVAQPIEHGNRCFFPARADDNPSLDLASYEESLRELGEAKYQQLRWGRWVRDGEGLVYSGFTTANLIDTLPAGGDWSCILGQDYGVSNATSWVILKWRKHDPVVYITRAWKQSGIIPSVNAEIVKGLEVEERFTRIVGDTSGLGKAFAEEAVQRYGVPIEAADKNNKRGYIELFNGELSRGRILIVRGPETEQLVHELKTLPWAENRIKEAAGFENHVVDGALYGWRAASAFVEKPAPVKPALGSREADELLAKIAQERRRANAQGRGESARERWRPGQR
jgi:hypothetical protein